MQPVTQLVRSADGGSEVDRSRPRVLVLAYHFPPGYAAGAARWENFGPILVRRGWGMDVITLDPSCLTEPEWQRVRSLPSQIRVFGARHPAVWVEKLESGAAAIRDFLTESFGSSGDSGDLAAEEKVSDDVLLPGLRGIPVRDLPLPWTGMRPLLRAFWCWLSYARERAWAREAVERARSTFDPELHRLLITTGPPHLSHRGGRVLAEETGLPLVLDFRDAWSVTEVLPEHLASPVWLWMADREESACIEAAALILANTEALRSRLAAKYPAAARRTMTVPNGWSRPVTRDPPAPSRFTIAYAGSIYLDRNPRVLMKAVSTLARERDLDPNELSLEFMGNMDDFGPGLETMAAQEGIADHLRLHPGGPREEALRFLSRASVLVSLPQSQSLAIPSKIFEYMTLPAWIVAQTRSGSATERLLRGTGAEVVEPDDRVGLTRTLDRLYEAYSCRGRPRPLAATCPGLRAEAVADSLLEELERWRGPKPDLTARSAG